MSLPAILWALRDVDCAPPEKLVLTVLCNWIDEHTDCSWPSVETIRSWTNQSRRTVFRIMASLEAQKLIARPTEQQRRKGRFVQNIVHIGINGPAVPPTPELVDLCIQIMQARRGASGAKVAHGGKPRGAKVAHGTGQNDTDGVPKWHTASIEDPVSRSSDNPVRAAAGSGAPAGVKPARLPPGLQRQIVELADHVRRNHPGRASSYVDVLQVDGDVVTAPSGLVLEGLRNHLFTECRQFGIDVDRIVISGK